MSSTTVSVKPELIRWAIKRSGLQVEALQFPVEKIEQWKRGEKQPTFSQLKKFAKRTMTPLGYMFLSTPPEEKLPIPDFRTMGDTHISRPSPNLIETVQTMQRRQAWMRDELLEQGRAELSFIGSLKGNEKIEIAAKRIRDALKLHEDWAAKQSTWEEALRYLRQAAENAGILVASSGVVGLNNHRHLDPQEFRGFVLCDAYAPLIFVNTTDTKSAQMFTMAHELMHLWLGYGGLVNLINMQPYDDERELFCNRVAAEFLIPGKKFTKSWPEALETANPYKTLARQFKVSPLVVARRAFDLRLVSKAKFFIFYNQHQEEWRGISQKKKKRGGNFYATQNVRLGRRFAYAVVCAAREGRLSYRDAYQLTDLRGDAFEKYAKRLIEGMRHG
ncbi:MAG: ImmA/IrrE family metallo-endopeptidase [Thermoguttaceae bacterium]